MGIFSSTISYTISGDEKIFINHELDTVKIKVTGINWLGLKPFNFKISDIESVRITQKENTIYETRTEGGITRAIIGGALFGSVGALVGASTAKQTTTQKTEIDYRLVFTLKDGTVYTRVCDSIKNAEKIINGIYTNMMTQEAHIRKHEEAYFNDLMSNKKAERIEVDDDNANDGVYNELISKLFKNE